LFVRDYMTQNPITINKKTPVFEALESRGLKVTRARRAALKP